MRVIVTYIVAVCLGTGGCATNILSPKARATAGVKDHNTFDRPPICLEIRHLNAELTLNCAMRSVVATSQTMVLRIRAC